jgi:cell cycle checkpoint control protein RAD9A
LNTSKSAYGSFKFQTHKFFSRYQYHGNARNRERFYCTIYIRVRCPKDLTRMDPN